MKLPAAPLKRDLRSASTSLRKYACPVESPEIQQGELLQFWRPDFQGRHCPGVLVRVTKNSPLEKIYYDLDKIHIFGVCSKDWRLFFLYAPLSTKICRKNQIISMRHFFQQDKWIPIV